MKQLVIQVHAIAFLSGNLFTSTYVRLIIHKNRSMADKQFFQTTYQHQIKTNHPQKGVYGRYIIFPQNLLASNQDQSSTKSGLVMFCEFLCQIIQTVAISTKSILKKCVQESDSFIYWNLCVHFLAKASCKRGEQNIQWPRSDTLSFYRK